MNAGRIARVSCPPKANARALCTQFQQIQSGTSIGSRHVVSHAHQAVQQTAKLLMLIIKSCHYSPRAERFFLGLAKRFFLKGLAEPSVEFELPQAIGEGPPAGSSFAASYWGNAIRGLFLAASYWGNPICNPICEVFFCSKPLGMS